MTGTPALPPARPLRGDGLHLVPLTDTDQLLALTSALQRPEVFAGGWGGGPAAYTDSPAEFTAFLARYLPPFGRPGVGYVAWLPTPTGAQVVGTTSFLVAAPEYRSASSADPAAQATPTGEATVEIGCTAYAPGVWGGVRGTTAPVVRGRTAIDAGDVGAATPTASVNAAAKLLMLTAAFDAGFTRVVFAVDNRNARSQAAVTKLGARLENVIPEHKQRADGTWRDTHLYAITASDWPAVRASLRDRLAHP